MTPTNPQASLEVSLAWSRSRPLVPERLRSPVTFFQGHFSVIREAARLLRERVEPRRERIVGSITHSQAEPPQLHRPFEGRVTVRAVVEGRSSRVRFVLSAADYNGACDAHRDRHRIEVTGILQRDARSRMFDLMQPAGFQILRDSSVRIDREVPQPGGSGS